MISHISESKFIDSIILITWVALNQGHLSLYLRSLVYKKNKKFIVGAGFGAPIQKINGLSPKKPNTINL